MFKYISLFCAIFVICRGDSCSFSRNDKNVIECCKTIFDLDYDEKEFNKAGSKCPANSELCPLIKCMLSNQGLMTADKININNTVSYILKTKDEAVWGKVVTDAAKTCTQKMVGKECPEIFFLDCVDVVSFVNCPKSEWVENEVCSQIKHAFSSCA